MDDKQLRYILFCAVSSRSQVEDDKISMAEQERAMREYVTVHRGEIIDILKVPGHSRAQKDIIDLLDEYEQKGITAYHDLRRYWKTDDFDVLLTYDPSRVGRSQSLVTWVFENVINEKRIIHLINGGTFNEENSEMGIAMCALNAVAGRKRMVKMTKAAMTGRMERGLSMNHPPFTHRLIYDETTGRAIRLEVKGELRQMFDAAATLLIEGAGWMTIPVQMAQRFGYINPSTGKMYYDSYFWRLFLNPYTWGYTAQRFAGKEGTWVFDESKPVPDRVIINRNPNPPVPPVYEGELAELIKAELLRRDELRGHASSWNAYKFSGLLVCDECKSLLGVAIGWKRKNGTTLAYYRCPAAINPRQKQCSQRHNIKEPYIIKMAVEYFDMMARARIYDIVEMIKSNQPNVKAQITETKTELSGIRQQIDTMIFYQAKADTLVQENYSRLISQESHRYNDLQEKLKRLQMQEEPSQFSLARQSATKQLIENPTAFWSMSNLEINQHLKRILGSIRFVVNNGEIIGLINIKDK